MSETRCMIHPTITILLLVVSMSVLAAARGDVLVHAVQYSRTSKYNMEAWALNAASIHHAEASRLDDEAIFFHFFGTSGMPPETRHLDRHTTVTISFAGDMITFDLDTLFDAMLGQRIEWHRDASHDYRVLLGRRNGGRMEYVYFDGLRLSDGDELVEFLGRQCSPHEVIGAINKSLDALDEPTSP